MRVKEVDTDRKRIALSMKREVSGAQGASGRPEPKQAGKPQGKPVMSAAPVKSDDSSNPFAALKNLKLN